MRPRIPLFPPVVRWLAVALVAGVVLFASVTRPAGVGGALGPFGVLGIDKYLHALAYAALAGTLAYALADAPVERVAVVVFLAAVGFGLGVELVQSALPYRTFSLRDAAANAVGATLAAVLWRTFSRRVRFRPVGRETDGVSRTR